MEDFSNQVEALGLVMIGKQNGTEFDRIFSECKMYLFLLIISHDLFQTFQRTRIYIF